MRHILRHAAVLTAFVLLGVLGLQAQDPQKITVTAKKYELYWSGRVQNAPSSPYVPSLVCRLKSTQSHTLWFW